MNIETLREFVVLGKSLNYTHAAKALYLDQSTLSRRIQALENEIGATLIRRSTRQVELTVAGKAFLEDAINVLGRYDRALERVHELDAKNTAVVRMGGVLTAGLGLRLITYANAAILKQHLPVVVEAYEPSSNPHKLTRISAVDPDDLLRQGSIDIALMYGSNTGDWSGVSHRVLLRDPFVLFVDENHSLAKRGRISIEDIAPFTLRTSVFYNKNNIRLAEVCEAHGFTPKTESKVVDSVGEWSHSCGENDAFMFMESCADEIPPQALSGLVKFQFDDPDAYYELWAVWRSDDDNPGIPLVLEALEESASLLG